MFRGSRQEITVLATLNHGVLISARRGYVVVNPEYWPENRRAFWNLKKLGNNMYCVLKMLIPNS